MTDADADFLVVGGGIAGASLAWALSPANSVTLLEAEQQPGFHATGRSAAFFSEIYGNETIRALTAASRNFFASPPAGFCDGPLLSPRDCLIVAAADRLGDLQTQFAELSAHSDAIKNESADFALERVPVLRRERVAGCIWEPDSQRIDVHTLLQGYLRGFRRRGGTVVTSAKVESAHRRGDEWTVGTTAGEFRGRVLVNAAGAWADQVAERAGASTLGLQPMRRTVAVIETDERGDSESWSAVTDFDESYYFMPEAGQLLLSPADETPTLAGDAYPDDVDVAIAVDRFEATTTLNVRRVAQQWAGLRTFAPDRVPVVGFDPAVPDFFWCAAQGGYGIQTAPAMARLGAALASRATVEAGLAAVAAAALTPGRFASTDVA